MIESEEMTKQIVAGGADPVTSTPEEYAANIEREEGNWAALHDCNGLRETEHVVDSSGACGVAR
jgi:tripartite-type tricarboxylate transporter receptor subunit TctC